MNEGMKQLQEFLSGLTVKQKAVMALGALLMAGTVWFFVRVLGTPEEKTLYTGLSANDAKNMVAKLSAKNIPYEMGTDGTSIQVAADQLDRARMETASQGLPRNARMGFEIFDTPNWMGTDFTDKVNYQRALEGELERTIQTLGEVEAARVHLVFPSESLFSERERDGKASVIVKTRGTLSAEKQFAIAQLVASAVDKLKPENVTVVDSETARPMRALEGGESTGGLGEQLSKQLVTTLEPVVGEGRVRATVRVEYDSSSFEDTQESYDPKSAVAVNLQRSEENSGGSALGGIPGTASNVPTGQKPPAVTVSSNGDQTSSKSEAGTYVVNKSLRHTIQPAGRLKRVTAAVIVDDALSVAADGKSGAPRKRMPEEMKELEQLSAAAIGLDQSRGDVLAVENLGFNQPAIEKPVPPSKLERVRVGVKNWSSVLRVGAILLLFFAVYLTILRPVKKQVLVAFKELPGRLANRGSHNPEISKGGEVVGEPGEPNKIGSLKKQLAEKVKVEPAAATKLVQSWIRETAR
jgi:flagellar M-ring protein FliF